MIGRIRLVNPERGTALAVVSGRLVATRNDGVPGAPWAARVVAQGREFHLRRPLWSEEIRALARAWPRVDLASGSRPGRLAATGLDPERWAWCAPSLAGEVRLAPGQRPSREELAALAGDALVAEQAEGLPLLDRYEVWLRDRETRKPLAQVRTALTIEEIRVMAYLPMWRFCPTEWHTPATWEFQNRVNERLNASPLPGRFECTGRIYQRLGSGAVAVKHGFDGSLWQVAPGELPEGQLAEPWESERIQLWGELTSRWAGVSGYAGSRPRTGRAAS